MDPYLESPTNWRDFHESFIAYARETLNMLLPPRYVARIEERLSIEPIDENIYPDLVLLKREAARRSVSDASVGTAVAEADIPVTISVLRDNEPKDSYIEIVAVRDRKRVVTTIEMLSPTNKTPGKGREDYVDKQRQLLDSPTHLIEIDLLRSGKHTVAPPLDSVLSKVGSFDYLVSLHRGGHGLEFEIWPNSVRKRLPRIRVPLDPPDRDIPLDLQAVFDRSYDTGAYDRDMDYSEAPDPPLEGEDAEWMANLLREKGLRE
jgi:hypothetical protein